MSRWCYKRQVRDNWTPERPWVVQYMLWGFDRDKQPRSTWWMLDFHTEVLRRACEEEKIFVFEDDREAGKRQKRCTSMTLSEALRVLPIFHDVEDKLLRLYNLGTKQVIMIPRSENAESR